MIRRFCSTLVLTSLLAAAPTAAQRFDGYSDEGGYTLAMPTTQFTLMDSFPAETTAVVDGYALAGRILAAVGDTVYLQQNPGSSRWLPVATTPVSMDPSFLDVSPDGSTIAIGTGWYKPLIVVASADLSTVAPIALGTWPGAKLVEANYYDAAWLDDRYLLINAGDFATSWVYAIDAQAPDPALTFVNLIEGIPGASGSVTVDPRGNVITGNGYGFAGDTGDLRIYPAATIASSLRTGSSIAWADGALLAKNVLSAAHMGFDAEGNLLVAGGDAFGGSGDLGYAAVIHADVVTRVLAGGEPLDRSDPAEFRKIVPATCGAHGYSSIQYFEGIDMLVSTCTYGSSGLEIFFPETAPDRDGDGIPDGVDNAAWSYNPDQTDANGDGIGDVGEIDRDGDGVLGRAELEAFVESFRATAADDTYDERFDFDRDGDVDWSDYRTIERGWAIRPPY